jgi:deoxyribodipyrimidine photo-lyase
MYSEKRSDPNNFEGTSDLSPFLHFGQISAQRIALKVEKEKDKAGYKESVGMNRLQSRNTNPESFLEELIIRRELADNFCHYNPAYDSFDGFSEWARKSLEAHKDDPRRHECTVVVTHINSHTYTKEQFETYKTHDLLWNAAQMQVRSKQKAHPHSLFIMVK